MAHQKMAPPRKQMNEKTKNVIEFPSTLKMRCAVVAMKRTEPQSTMLAKLFAVSVDTAAV